MDIEVIVEGEGVADVETIRIPHGSAAREIVVGVAAKGRFPAEEGILFLEDSAEPLDLAVRVIEEAVSGKVHRVHRAREIEATVFYMGLQKPHRFPPSTRIQRVLDWTVGPWASTSTRRSCPELIDFFDQDMLQLFESERFLFDHVIPRDRKAL